MIVDAQAVIHEIAPTETATAFSAMRELRPHLSTADVFVDQVDNHQRAEGYRLFGVFENGENDAAAVIGFRFGTNLAWGNLCYVDDLSTKSSARGRGYARALLDAVAKLTADAGLSAIHLDSGVGPERLSAHRLYLNSGYRITSYHFARPVLIV